MLSTARAIIAVTILQRYHQFRHPLKLALTTLPTEATINTTAWLRYHHCHCQLRLSSKFLPDKAIIIVIAVWSNHWWRRHWSQYFPYLSTLAATSVGLESNKMRLLICRTWDNRFKSNIPFFSNSTPSCCPHWLQYVFSFFGKRPFITEPMT